MSLEHKLDGLLSKHDELQNLLATQSGMGGQEYARLSKEFTELNEIVRVVKIYREVESEIRNLNVLLDEDISDSEVTALAEEEYDCLAVRSRMGTGPCRLRRSWLARFDQGEVH